MVFSASRVILLAIFAISAVNAIPVENVSNDFSSSAVLSSLLCFLQDEARVPHVYAILDNKKVSDAYGTTEEERSVHTYGCRGPCGLEEE